MTVIFTRLSFFRENIQALRRDDPRYLKKDYAEGTIKYVNYKFCDSGATKLVISI